MSVYLVGAGPGDPALITVRGKELLAQADCVIYDYLVNRLLLKVVNPDAVLIYVGKSFKGHTKSQDEINDLLVQSGKKYQKVVRLKGGDPTIFGRGGEEAEVLAQAGIAFEIVPGISSAIAAPAYAGIPVTHREHNSMVSFITGHEDPTKLNSHLDWKKLANNHATLVFLMGVGQLPEIAKQLMAHGMDSTIPVAVISWGTWPRQKTFTGTLSNIAQVLQDNQVAPPAVIVIGKVVALREKIAWFEKQPLLGKRIVVTRARAQSSDLLKLLQSKGAEVIEFPTIKIDIPKTNPALEAEIKKQYDWIIFTSVNGVIAFWDCLKRCGLDARALAGVKVCAIGPATQEEIEKRGILVDCLPPKYVAESVVEELKKRGDLKGKRFLLPRAKEARSLIVDELTKAGALVKEVAAYETKVDNESQQEVLASLKERAPDVVTFTSSSTVKNFIKLVGKEKALFAQTKFVSIGPVTTETAKENGLEIAAQPEEYTIPGLVGAIEKLQ